MGKNTKSKKKRGRKISPAYSLRTWSELQFRLTLAYIKYLNKRRIFDQYATFVAIPDKEITKMGLKSGSGGFSVLFLHYHLVRPLF